jgi:DNA primase
VAIMSNRITVEQVDKIERWLRQLADGRVSLLFDADGPGMDGAKEALWLLAEHGLQVRIGWPRNLHTGGFAGSQPENLTREKWEQEICLRLWRE